MRRVEESPAGGTLRIWRHPEWSDRFPWLIQGTTGRGEEPDDGDLGLFGSVPVADAQSRWRRLREETGMRTAVHSRQVHGAEIAQWRDPLPAGLVITEGFDAHVTRGAGTLLTISVADCVPVFLVEEETRSVAIVHAGWRGIAAGVVEAAIQRLSSAGAETARAWLHCGPSICGACYEVGPEVHSAVNPGSEAADRGPIDLTAAIARRAASAGLREERMTRSTHCTLCGGGRFFSHRGGSTGRQLGIVGIRS